jgi:molybdopterin molybdotransferase
VLGDLGAEVVDLGIIPDDEGRIRSALLHASSTADAVVTSGGVSMGEHDLVKAVLADLGRIEFWQVAMQPAKPFAFGFLGDAPLFGLPGNPVSAIVGFEQFVRPALLRRMGSRRLFRPRSAGTLAEPVATNPDKTVFLRMTVSPVDGAWHARLAGGQASNVLSGLALADAFGVVPVGVGSLEAGDPITLEWFRSPESRTAEEADDE